MTEQQPNYDEYSSTVLYDVFHEAATALTGRLVALENQDRNAAPEQARQWVAERREVAGDRRAIPVEDRAAQVAAITRWQARRAALGEFIERPTSGP